MRDDRGMSAPQTRHVFVAGNSRSGTTMLARMLGRHSQVHGLQELHFAEEMWLPGSAEPLDVDQAVDLADRLLHNAREWYHTRRTPGAFAAPARGLVDALEADRLAVGAAGIAPTDVLAAVLDLEAAEAGKQIAVEQTPRNVFYLSALLDSIPGSRAVVLVRDPRDVLLSQKNWWRRRFRGTSGVPLRTTVRQWVDYHPLTTSLIWRGGVRAGLRAAGRPDVTLLRFEDLVTDPQTVLKSLLDDLGLELEPAVLEAPRISSSNAGNRDGVGVDPGVVGRFRDGLSRAEIWTSQRVTATEARELGYDAVPVGTPAAGLLLTAVAFPFKTALALAMNAGRSRNLLTSILRRVRP